MLEKWANEEVTLRNKLIDLQSRCTLLQQLVQRTVTSVSETAKAAGIFLAKPSDALEKHQQAATELFADLQKRKGQQREQLENNTTMTKVVVRTLKTRTQLFVDCFTQIRFVLYYNFWKIKRKKEFPDFLE